MEGVAWSPQWIPTPVNLDFLDPEPLLFHSSCSSVILTRLSGPVPDTLFLRKFGNAGNRARDLWICSRELWPLDHRGGQEAEVITLSDLDNNDAHRRSLKPLSRIWVYWLGIIYSFTPFEYRRLFTLSSCFYGFTLSSSSNCDNLKCPRPVPSAQGTCKPQSENYGYCAR
jgi:hypothetical protein